MPHKFVPYLLIHPRVLEVLDMVDATTKTARATINLVIHMFTTYVSADFPSLTWLAVESRWENSVP